MTREEKTAWAFVGSEVAIIILLLLTGAPPTVENRTLNIGGITFPDFDPINFNIETRPANAYPVSITFGDVINQPIEMLSNQPCDCGCTSGGGYIAGYDWSDYIAQMNADMQAGVISTVSRFYSQLPGDLYFLTNNTRIPALETGIW